MLICCDDDSAYISLGRVDSLLWRNPVVYGIYWQPAAEAIPVAKKRSDVDCSPLLRFFGPDSMNAAGPILFFYLPFLLYLVSSIFCH